MNDFIIRIYYSWKNFKYLNIRNCKYTMIPVLFSDFKYACTYICSSERNLNQNVHSGSLWVVRLYRCYLGGNHFISFCNYTTSPMTILTSINRKQCITVKNHNRNIGSWLKMGRGEPGTQNRIHQMDSAPKHQACAGPSRESECGGS